MVRLHVSIAKNYLQLFLHTWRHEFMMQSPRRISLAELRSRDCHHDHVATSRQEKDTAGPFCICHSPTEATHLGRQRSFPTRHCADSEKGVGYLYQASKCSLKVACARRCLKKTWQTTVNVEYSYNILFTTTRYLSCHDHLISSVEQSDIAHTTQLCVPGKWALG